MGQIPHNPGAIRGSQLQAQALKASDQRTKAERSKFDEIFEKAAKGDQGPAKRAERTRIDQAIAASSRKYNLSARLIRSVIKQESGFKPHATSHCGAQGLMQLMPATAKNLGVKDAYSIEQNVEGGCKYLRQMLDRYDGNLEKALAAYNAGPGAVDRHGGIPPYKETQNYVVSIKSHFAKDDGPEGGAESVDFNQDIQPLLGQLGETLKATEQALAESVIAQVGNHNSTLDATRTAENRLRDPQEEVAQGKRIPIPAHAILG